MALPIWLPLQAQQQTEPKLDPVKTSITIVENISAEAPAAVSVMEREEIQNVPGVNLDDRLRQVPGFSLFRRSSGMVAHPTTQGVSLRGIGSSGASRTLVLWDGLPLNDPFGGWVYWTRVSPDEVERVEISRGASTSVFGDRALGGAISLFSRPPARHRLTGRYEGGNNNSHDLSAGYSHLWRRFAASAGGRAYSTDGYFIIPEHLRGAVDREAGVRFVAADARLDYFSGRHRLFFKTDILAEERRNGTALQNNSTGLGTASARYHLDAGSNALSLVGFHTREEFRSTFSQILAERNSERITFLQTVPSEAVGAAALWRRDNRRWNSLIGFDLFRVEGFSTDTFPAEKRVGGGSQLQHGAFAQFDATAGPARLFFGARHHFTGQDRSFFSPSAGAVVGKGRVRARGSVYRSFRAPTLNELFRDFRVGNAETRANSALAPETVFGAEAGLDFVGETSHARLTFYRNSLEDLIANVTLSATGGQIVRQRQNAASALNRGVELEVQHRRGNWSGEAGYLFVDSRFSTGFRVPQIPKHQGSAQVTWQHGGTLATAGIRSYSFQFEDERNLAAFVLPGYASVQFVLRQRLAKGLSALVAIENMLDREYVTALSPTPLTGTPRLWRAGLRWESVPR
ncbi:MAG: TonB-dependent receptor [Bryobacteraceae bacterium]